MAGSFVDKAPFLSALDNCERLIETPSHLSTSAASRDMSSWDGPQPRPRTAARPHAKPFVFLSAPVPKPCVSSTRRCRLHEITAPLADRILTNPESLRYPTRCPTFQRQKHRPRSIRLTTIRTARQGPERVPIFLRCPDFRLPAIASPPTIRTVNHAADRGASGNKMLSVSRMGASAPSRSLLLANSVP